MNHDYSSYRDGENTLEKEIADQHADTFQLCVDVWEYLHSKLIRSADRQIPLFMPFKQQVDIGCFCAIKALTHLHSASYHQNFRYALENMAICIYHLVKPEEFNELFSKEATERDEGKFAGKARIKGYELMKTKYPKLNKAFIAMKEITNTYGAHATFSSTVSNIKLGKDKCETNLFDTLTKFVIDARFLSLADAMIAFANSIIKERWDEKMLPLYTNAEEELKILSERWKILQNSIMEERKHKSIPTKGKDRNKPCWCGSEIKQKKCHG